MKILRQVEIIIFMAIFFAEFILSFAQYEMKSSDSYAPYPWVNSNAVWVVRTATSSSTCFSILLSNLLRNEDFAPGCNYNFYGNFFSLNLYYLLLSMI